MNRSNTPSKTENQTAAHEKHHEEHEEEFVRFNVFHRIMHVLVMVSFMGLVFTGAPLKYRNAGWAKVLMSLYGGVHTAGVLHRGFAVITFTYFICEAVYGVVYCFIILRLPVFGPDSMVPRIKDLHDLIGNIKYFFGRGPKPEFDRFTYWEKFDYIAVFWGMIAIGATGLMLAFPDLATLLLPGKALNIATIVHSDEALLAAGFIFIVHWYNTHWRPERFPLDPVIFTGHISKEELMHERPTEWKRMVENPELMEKMRVKSK